MDKTRFRSRLASVLGGGAFLLTAGNALASYNVASQGLSGDTWGNDYFSAKYRYETSESSFGGASEGSASRTSQATQLFSAHASVLGKSLALADWQAVGQGKLLRSGTSAPVYTDKVALKAVLAGDELFNVGLSDVACPGAPATQSCLSYDRSLSKTLFQREQVFWLSIVPIVVTAKVVGGLTMSAASSAMALSIRGVKDSVNASGRATLVVSAFVDARVKGVVGIEGYIGGGAEARVRLIEAGLSSTTQSSQSAEGNSILVVHTNEMPLTLKSLDGDFSIFADIAGHRESMTLIDWTGYEWSRTLVGFKNVIVRPAA